MFRRGLDVQRLAQKVGLMLYLKEHQGCCRQMRPFFNTHFIHSPETLATNVVEKPTRNRQGQKKPEHAYTLTFSD
jgi:hypothetical protein